MRGSSEDDVDDDGVRKKKMNRWRREVGNASSPTRDCNIW